MKSIKIFFGMLLLCFLFCTSAQAIEVSAVANITGSQQPAASFYFPITDDMQIITGFSAVLPGTKTKAVDLDLLLGVSAPIYFLGITETIFNFSKWSVNTTDGSNPATEVHLDSISFRKNYLYKLTDEIDIGLQMVMAEIMIQGDKVINILPGLYPIIKANVSIP
ncbi:hypothetical protein ACFLZV_01615 [Candidatus Margulisiibacteriota bacterium]